MLGRRRLSVSLFTVLCFVVSAAAASAESLAIKTGSWKKTVRITTNGEAGEPITLDVCFTKEDLDLEKLLSGFPDTSCKWTKREVSAKRLDVAFACSTMSGVSVTEVKSSDRVTVASTIEVKQQGQSVRMESSEEWSYVGPDCPKSR